MSIIQKKAKKLSCMIVHSIEYVVTIEKTHPERMGMRKGVAQRRQILHYSEGYEHYQILNGGI